MEKCCQYCCETLVQRPDEKASAFARRRYCGKVCAAKDIPPKKRKRSPGIVIPKARPLTWA